MVAASGRAKEQQHLFMDEQNTKRYKASRDGLKSLQTELQTQASETVKKIKWQMPWPSISISMLMVSAAWRWSTIHNAPSTAAQVLANQQINFKQ